MPEGSPIRAVLGPTNTGKTHRAVERMLAYDSGIIGLPLRLLAREVYDRITAQIGEARVALVTGEEKRVPRSPDYWVCTVEAMPQGREVDFVAVDEIQLAENDQRGHVFTERLLHARGRRETWFMGADTMRGVISELLPTAKLEQHPRLSSLRDAGAQKLSRMPPRTAIVAFSTTQVYELAERVRALRGGAAVVLGALSPRTRNAQVALFSSGEVDYLIATDAIGMGLNLDVHHVAFGALRKFDGRSVRGLDEAELAQIAGRAGRYLRDGTFGTTLPLRLPEGVGAAIEAHRFSPVKRVRYRNSDLDLSSLDALLASLRERPRSPRLRLTDDAEDHAALAELSSRPEIRARARGPEAVSLLWDVCRIPDFRKLLLGAHVALLAEVFTELSGRRGLLSSDWMARRITAIDDPTGDIDTLIGKIASIRTFTYISNHARWVDDATHFQEETRAIEDRLSDALHDRLVARFVERKGARGKRAPRARSAQGPSESAVEASSQPESPFAVLLAMRDALAPKEAPKAHSDPWIESVIASAHERFSVDTTRAIRHDDVVIAELSRGPTLLLPEVRLVGLENFGAAPRSRLIRRLTAFARDLVETLLAPLRSPALRALSGAARGIVYQLEQGLGTALTEGAKDQVSELDPHDRSALESLGIVVGERVMYVEGLLKPSALAHRLALCAAWGGEKHLTPPRKGAVSFQRTNGLDDRLHLALGFPVFGPRAIRADMAERAAAALAHAEGEERRITLARVASWIGCSARQMPSIAHALARA